MRISIDIGGTFTDIVAFDPQSGRLETLKVSSTPKRLMQAVSEGLQAVLSRVNKQAADVGQLVHGTTVATNAILEGKWAKSALITTAGFRDVLEIGRQDRPELYNFFTQKPRPLVPRQLRYEVPERLDYQGRVIHPLQACAVKEIATQLKQQEVESVAVVLLFSYLNPEHEKRVRELLSAELDLPVVLSCETLPEFREYERTSTTVMNAALVPVLRRYLQELDEETRKLGFSKPWRIMQSNAGITNSRLAGESPVTLLLSGPAGGVEGARFVGELSGYRDVITLDMGGTSTDVSLIQQGRPRLTNESHIDGRPLRIPMVDIKTIGAGGGSVAWVDSGGALRVGPESAGAQPGPVCYGRGGARPTVTDAQLVLGRLDPHSVLGDIPSLDREAACQAIDRQLAQPLEMRVEEAALGVLTVALSNMERAIRVISVERGHDPRAFALLSFGGAGPLHACELARRLGIPTVIVPQAAGVLSALGLLSADLIHQFVQTLLQDVQQLDLDQVNRVFQAFRQQGRKRLVDDGLNDEQMTFIPSFDLRYQGQSYELNLSVADKDLHPSDLEQLVSDFHQEHHKRYGHAAVDEPVEVVNLRLMAQGKRTRPALLHQGIEQGAALPFERRQVYFGKGTAWVDCPCYKRDRLNVSAQFDGPAIVEGSESTVVVQPGQTVHVDGYGNLIVEVPYGSQS